MNNSKKPVCRFNLFVVLKVSEISPFRNNQRSWCFRGDKYYSSDQGMIRSLLKHIKKDGNRYRIMELYDVTRAEEYELQIILKISAGTVEINLLKEYQDLLKNFILPEPI